MYLYNIIVLVTLRDVYFQQLMVAMSVCHTLRPNVNEVQGDALDKAMFLATGSKLRHEFIKLFNN